MRIFDLFLIFIIPQFLFAQYNPVIIGVEQGLSQSAVRSIAQDSEGFLWIATWDGLNRYDGHTFVNYNHNPGSKSSLSNNNLIHLTFDGTDRPWVTAISGEINLLNKRTNTFSLLRDKQGKPLTANYNGFPVNFDDAHMVFLSPSGVILTRTSDLVSTKLIEVKKNEFTNMNGKVLAVFHTEKDLLLVNNLRKVTKIPLEFRIIFTSTLKNDVVLMLSSTGELYEFNTIKLELKRVTKLLASNAPLSFTGYEIHTDRRGIVRIATSEGLFSLDREKRIFQKLTPGEEKEKVRINGQVYAISEDYIGNIWVGTYSGLIKMEKTGGVFYNYPDGDNPGINPQVDRITSMLPLSDSKCLTGTTHGFYTLDEKSGRFRRHQNILPGFDEVLVYKLLRDNKGDILAGTKKGLLKLEFTGDNLKAKVIRFSGSPEKEEWINRVTSITEGDDGVLWVGTINGLIKYSPGSGEQTIYNFDADFGNEGDTYILSLYFDDGILWVGTNSEGLLRINTSDMTHTRFSTYGKGAQKLSNDKIMAIHKDKTGRIWLATMGGGINILELNSINVKIISTSDGLANNSVYGILEDKPGNIWVSTNKGLSRIDSHTLKPRNYTHSDGLVSNGYNQFSYLKGRDGKFYFGGSGGITVFDPEKMIPNPVKPKVALTDFRIFNNPSLERIINKEVELDYDENFLSFEMAALNFEDPAYNEYQWKLEGLTDQWVHAGKRRTVDVSNIAPGSYQLIVKAANREGVWSEETLLAKIEVIPPFWKTAWFAILATLLMLSLVVFISVITVRRKMKREIEELEREKMILMERNKTRDRIARDLHDDLASTVSGAGLYMQSATSVLGEDEEAAMTMIKKSASLLQEAEQAMRDIVWSVSPEYDSIENLVLRIRLLTRELCDAAGISFEFSKNGEFSLMLRDEIRRNLYLSTKEAVMNAVKHSGGNKIVVTIDSSSDAISIMVRDNGTGFRMETKAEKLGGNGLKNIRKRCDEIGAKAEITSTEGTGTTVLIDYKIKN